MLLPPALVYFPQAWCSEVEFASNLCVWVFSILKYMFLLNQPSPWSQKAYSLFFFFFLHFKSEF